MNRLRRFRVAAVIALALTFASMIVAAPTAASPPRAGAVAATSGSLAAPTDLRQIGTNAFGYPILAWTWGAPDESGIYTVRYQGPAPATGYIDDYFDPNYSGDPYDTYLAASAHCLPGGTYQVTVYYGFPATGVSGPSNTITITLPPPS